MKKVIGKMLRKCLPFSVYKLIANGFIVVPSYYKAILADTEKYMNISLGESDEKELMLLRKYAHIIDKGLHRIDAKPGHSKDICELLKQTVHRLENTKYAKDPTYLWAKVKLQKYDKLQSEPQNFEPNKADIPVSSIDYNSLFSLIKERRSNRRFEHKILTEDIIYKLKDVSNWAANSCNKQPIKLFVTNNPTFAKECLACCKGGTGFGDYIPSFWAFTADCRGYVWPTEMFLPTLDTSLGAQNVFLAAQTLGISGTILSWAQKDDYEDSILRKLLNIPDEYLIVFCAVMGYAEFQYMTPNRKTTE